MLRHLLSFIQLSNSDLQILPPQQFAYRRRHSCEDALSLCINNWHAALDKGLVTGVVLLDLSKAFDTVSHQSLLLDLQSCGLSGDILTWFTTYLAERSQSVVAPNLHPGHIYTSTRGVPQGSVLGPLLFTIFTRALPQVLRYATCSLYADDICLYVSGKDMDDVKKQLECDVESVSAFLKDKGLQLNETKTEYLMIRRDKALTPPSLNLPTLVIPPSSTARYLGLVIDEFLTFAPHVQLLTNRVYAKLKAFKRVRTLFDTRARRTFYISFIQSMLEYASNAYVHCLRAGVYEKLITLSKRAQRYVFGYPPATTGLIYFALCFTAYYCYYSFSVSACTFSSCCFQTSGLSLPFLSCLWSLEQSACCYTHRFNTSSLSFVYPFSLRVPRKKTSVCGDHPVKYE